MALDEDLVKQEIQLLVKKGSIQDLEHSNQAIQTAHREHDGVEAAKAVLRLFMYDDDGMVFGDL